MTEPLRLVSYKAWFIPADRKTYRTLVSIGFPTTRIHRDSIAILKMVLKKHGHRAVVEPFAVHRDKFYDAVADWCDRHENKCRIAEKSQVYRFANTELGKKHARIIEKKTRDFWTRWGFTGDISLTESATQIRVNCEVHKVMRNPVIALKNPIEQNTRHIIDLGTYRFCTSTDSRFLLWELEIKAGSEWKPYTRGKQLLTHVTDPSGVIGDLLKAFNAE